VLKIIYESSTIYNNEVVAIRKIKEDDSTHRLDCKYTQADYCSDRLHLKGEYWVQMGFNAGERHFHFSNEVGQSTILKEKSTSREVCGGESKC
jgi:hypothetical protein